MIARILRPFLMPCSHELTWQDWLLKIGIIFLVAASPTICDAILHGPHVALAAWGIHFNGH